MSLSSNALCAKAKAMYGGRLNKNVYLDLTRKQTIGEVVSYLKSQTSYADALKDINITCSSWSNRRLFKSRILSSLCEVDEIFT